MSEVIFQVSLKSLKNHLGDSTEPFFSTAQNTPTMLNKNLKTVIKNLFLSFRIDCKTLDEIAEKIKNHYFKYKAVTLIDIDTIVKVRV